MSAACGPNERFVVLAALDASEAAHEVLRVAANFARMAPRGELHLVHVVEELPPPVSLVPPPVGLGITAGEIVASARAKMVELASEARGQFRGPISTRVAGGSASKEILQAAADLQADVVLVGTHGRSGVKRLMLGSVAEKVSRRASCPVVVVREKNYASIPPEVEPACPECLRAQRESDGAKLTCAEHAENPLRRELHVLAALGPGRG
jgi:nucleotide-binding universal stress UspA family protein